MTIDLTYHILSPDQALRITLQRADGRVLVRSYKDSSQFAELLERTDLSNEARAAFDRDIPTLGQMNDSTLVRKGREIEEADIQRLFGDNWSVASSAW